MDRAARFYAPLGAKVVGRPPEIRFPNGVIFRTGHMKDDQAWTKYLGQEHQKLYIEELTLIPSLNNYKNLRTTCRSTIKGLDPQVLATTNPLNIGHLWVKEYFVDEARDKPYRDPETGLDRIFIPSKITDNPILMLMNPGYHNSLRGLAEDERRTTRS